jgi:GT2 family glycosyltransferase
MNTLDRPIPVDPHHDVVIVIPTVAHPAVLIPTFERLVADAMDVPSPGRMEGDRVRVGLVLSVNGPDPEEATQAAEACQKIAAQFGVDLAVAFEDHPIGFSAANNRGLMAAIQRWGGCAELVIFHNDDAHIPRGFCRRMLDALRTQTVHGFSEPWSIASGLRPDRTAASYGRIGLVGPCSNLVAGVQQVTELVFTDGRVAHWRGDVDGFDQAIAARYPGQRVTADFLSGFCIGVSREALPDLMLWRVPGIGFLVQGTDAPDAEAIGPWDEDRYPIAGYEDNDLCLRAELAGWRCIVASDTFVGHIGHQTFDRLFPEALRGMRNRAAYYERWRGLTRPEGGHRLVAVFRLRFEVAHDIHLFRLALLRSAQIVDGVAIELTANPLDVKDDIHWPSDKARLTPADEEMLRACGDADAAQVAEVVRAWACALVATTHEGRLGSTPEAVRPNLLVEVWAGEFNEREERNASIALGEQLSPTWILSIDHDEVIENRLTRRHFDRAMEHPDPLVRSWDQSWINHWDSERLMRIDRPWGDGNQYIGGMHGFRLWRSLGRRIFAGTGNGLHCGNSPDHDSSSKRVSGIRFRHFGYLRHQDRVRKHKRYHVQDPNPDPMLTGNLGGDGYSHLLHEEGMHLSPFSPMTGIGLTMLIHPGESPNDLARVLDSHTGLVDRVILVWTAAWAPEDQEAVLLPAQPIEAAKVAERDEVIARYHAWIAEHAAAAPPGAKLPVQPPRLRAARRVQAGALGQATGPSSEMLAIIEAFGCEMIHQPLDNDIAAARNAGLEALSTSGEGMGWSLFSDLDEHFAEPYAALVAIRRMAEVTDTHAWLFRFVNTHREADPTASESYRMARLVKEMRLSGRVHETYDLALERLREAGHTPKVRVAPFTVTNTGLDQADAEMDRKVEWYRELLLLELQDRPHNSAAWVSLGLALMNDGNEVQAEQCLGNALLCAGEGFLAPRELALFHLRRARPLFLLALERSKGHPWYAANRDLGRYLAEQVPPMPLLGSARHRELPPAAPIELPAFTPPEHLSGMELVADSLGE